MKIYSWKTVGFDANAQKVGEELEKIENDGEINSEEILNYAEKHKDSELYKCFEWDDTEASRKFRMLQASRILSSISLKIKETPAVKQKLYFSIRSASTEERTFKNIKDIVENDEEYTQLVNKAKDDLNRCTEKYEDLVKKQDLKDIIFEIYKNI